MTKRRAKLIRTGIIALLFGLMALIIYIFLKRFMPELLPLLQAGDEPAIEAYIRSFGSGWGMLVAAVLQAIQVLTILFPALAIQVASGILFGWWKGMLICLSSFSATNFGVFYAARRLKNRLGALMHDTEAAQSKLKFIAESDCPEFMIFLAYMMPFLPNGFIPYVAAGTPVSNKRFFAAMTLGSAPSILLFCAIGNRLLQKDFLVAGILSVLMIAAIITLFLLRDKVVEAVRRFRRSRRSRNH